jgi:hypothetical protein
MRVAALVALSTVVAACGESSASSNPYSTNYDPAKTTLKAVGLEVCSDEQSQSLPDEPGAQASRKFFVASDCMGKKTSPNTVAVYQFNSKQSVTAGAAAIRAAMPNASSTVYGPLVIVTLGPDGEANLAAIEAQLKKTTPTTTTS